MPTTQAVVSGMSAWTPEQWVVFFGAIGAFVGTLVTAIVAIKKAGKAEISAEKATTANEINSARITNTALHAQKIDSEITTLAKDVGKITGGDSV